MNSTRICSDYVSAAFYALGRIGSSVSNAATFDGFDFHGFDLANREMHGLGEILVCTENLHRYLGAI